MSSGASAYPIPLASGWHNYGNGWLFRTAGARNRKRTDQGYSAGCLLYTGHLGSIEVWDFFRGTPAIAQIKGPRLQESIYHH